MNKEVIKAMNGEKEKKLKIHKWWKNCRHAIFAIILLPFRPALIAYARFKKWSNEQIVWNEEKAKEIFDYYIPRDSDWDDKNKSFYFFDNGCGWNYSHAKKLLKRKDRKFWRKYAGTGGFMMRHFLLETYELEGFSKELLDCSYGWTEIEFKKK